MLNWLTNIYRQVTETIELDSASVKNYEVGQWNSTVIVSDLSYTTGVLNLSEGQVLSTASATGTGIIGRSELSEGYPELVQAVGEKNYGLGQWNSTVTVSSLLYTTGVLNLSEGQVLSTVSGTSTGIAGRSELREDYLELGRALSEMVELEEDDEWRIDEPVYTAACRIAAELMLATPYSAPRVFSHGPKSVVFNWSKGTENLYLTIGSDMVSALSSSLERIKQRIDLPINQLPNPALLLSSIQPNHQGRAFALIKAASDDPQELFD